MIINTSGGGGSRPVWTKSGTELDGAYATDILTIPERLDGVELNTTINMMKTARLTNMINASRKIVVPERYTNVQYGWASSYYPQWEELILEGATVFNTGNVNNCRYLKRLSYPKWAGEVNRWSLLCSTSLDASPVSTELDLDFPLCTAFNPDKIGTSGHIVALTVNMPSVTGIGTKINNLDGLRYCEGNWVFKSCVGLGYWPMPQTEQTLRLPAIRTIYEPFITGGSGVINLYLGPNLGSIMNSALSVMQQNSNIKIHIPPGTNDTMIYLTNYGVPFTADYNYQEDL